LSRKIAHYAKKIDRARLHAGNCSSASIFISYMSEKHDSYTIAKCIADEVEKISPLDCNIAAMLTAQLLCEGKNKRELQDISHFLQLVILAIRTYMN